MVGTVIHKHRPLDLKCYVIPDVNVASQKLALLRDSLQMRTDVEAGVGGRTTRFFQSVLNEVAWKRGIIKPNFTQIKTYNHMFNIVRLFRLSEESRNSAELHPPSLSPVSSDPLPADGYTVAPRLSLIIPAFNEIRRLPNFLDEVQTYLDSENFISYEVIVVDDGSRDNTAEMVLQRMTSWPQLRLLQHAENRGKGAAVREGMLAAVLPLLLFADADGATSISDERRLREAIARGADLAVGSRLVSNPSVVVNRATLRAISGRCFAWAVGLFTNVTVRDPQCGFKMFQRDVACRLFRDCNENGYLFDILLLSLANILNYRIAEVPVSWEDKSGSKVRIFKDGWKMMCGLLRVRRSAKRMASSAGAGMDRTASRFTQTAPN